MEISTAKSITKSFINKGEKREPIFASDWEFILKKDTVYIISEQNNVEYIFSSLNNYSREYVFGPFKNIVKDNKLIDGAYFTSIGFVSAEDFFLAEDILENIKKIKLSEMKEGHIYLSDKGKEYLFIKEEIQTNTYVKDNNFTHFRKKRIQRENTLYDITFRKYVKFNSVKLIKEVNRDFNDNIIYKPIEDSYYSIIYSKGKMSINNNEFIFDRIPNFFALRNKEYKKREIYKFIESDLNEIEI